MATVFISQWYNVLQHHRNTAVHYSTTERVMVQAREVNTQSDVVGLVSVVSVVVEVLRRTSDESVILI